jgi:hypothetical protein
MQDFARILYEFLVKWHSKLNILSKFEGSYSALILEKLVRSSFLSNLLREIHPAHTTLIHVLSLIKKFLRGGKANYIEK